MNDKLPYTRGTRYIPYTIINLMITLVKEGRVEPLVSAPGPFSPKKYRKTFPRFASTELQISAELHHGGDSWEIIDSMRNF
jgi:hypothetical protein